MTNEKFDIIVLAGQSNAGGCGAGETKYTYEPDEDIYVLKGDYTATAQKTEYGNEYLDIKLSNEYYTQIASQKGGCGSFALSFAQMYKKNNLQHGRKILIVQTAIGGTGFAKNHWAVGEYIYDRMIKMVEYALSFNKENRIIAFLWHQGEHDSFENPTLNFEERKNFYYDKLCAMIDGVREKFGEVPFVGAGFTRLWFENYPEQCKAIYSAMDKIALNKSQVGFVSNTEDLLSNAETVFSQDKVHFSKEALYLLGLRYYKKWCEIKK